MQSYNAMNRCKLDTMLLRQKYQQLNELILFATWVRKLNKTLRFACVKKIGDTSKRFLNMASQLIDNPA